MCFDLDSDPPITPIAGAVTERKSMTLTASDGAHFGAFHAVPEQKTGKAIVILPDVRGLHHYYEELAVRFAEIGVEAVAIDYFGRTAGIGSRGEEFDYRAHVPKTTWTGISADIAAAVDYLRTSATSGDSGSKAVGSPSIFTIGFCMGGRNAYLSSTIGLGLAGVIGFYGWPVGSGSNSSPAPIDAVNKMECPVLGIFGGADENIRIDTVQSFRDALLAAHVESDVVVEPDAPHSFFDRKQSEFQAQSDDAWSRVQHFIAHHRTS
jgi:carboxymethylenebutenolidase